MGRNGIDWRNPRQCLFRTLLISWKHILRFLDIPIAYHFDECTLSDPPLPTQTWLLAGRWQTRPTGRKGGTLGLKYVQTRPTGREGGTLGLKYVQTRPTGREGGTLGLKYVQTRPTCREGGTSGLKYVLTRPTGREGGTLGLKTYTQIFSTHFIPCKVAILSSSWNIMSKSVH